MTGAVPQREEAAVYSRVRATHRIVALLYRQYPAALTVEAVSAVAAGSRSEARAGAGHAAADQPDRAAAGQRGCYDVQRVRELTVRRDGAHQSRRS